MAFNLRALTRSCVVVASTLWIAATVYEEFFDVDPSLYGFENPEMETRLRTCTGTFLERYRCKEDIIIEKGHHDFLIWVVKVALVFGPPGVLFGLLRLTRPAKGDDDDFFDGPTSPPPRDISHWRVR